MIDLAVFDNHRVLHGRSSFTGQRRLCGAYVNHDDYRSRYVGLRKQFGPSGNNNDDEHRRVRMLRRSGLVPRASGGPGGGGAAAWDGYP